MHRLEELGTDDAYAARALTGGVLSSFWNDALLHQAARFLYRRSDGMILLKQDLESKRFIL